LSSFLKRHFQRSEGFFLIIWKFCKHNKAFWKHFQISRFQLFLKTFSEKLRLFQGLRRLFKYIFSGIGTFLTLFEAFSAMALNILIKKIWPQLENKCKMMTEDLWSCHQNLIPFQGSHLSENKYADKMKKKRTKTRKMKNIAILVEHSSVGPGVEIDEIY
jgi:hypothetical protein